jgi:hypothetical protein
MRKMTIPPAAVPFAALLFTLVLVDDAANNLAWLGHLDQEAEEWPGEVLAELAALVVAGPCGLCPGWQGWPGPDVLADHWLARRQDEWEQSLPVWECGCGARYKIIGEWGGLEHYYQARPDGLVGERAGEVRRNHKGAVKHSDACPACGVKYTDTHADRANPQQALF